MNRVRSIAEADPEHFRVNVCPSPGDSGNDFDRLLNLGWELGNQRGDVQISTLQKTMRSSVSGKEADQGDALTIFSVKPEHLGDIEVIKADLATLLEDGSRFVLFVVDPIDYDDLPLLREIYNWNAHTDIAMGLDNVAERLSLQDGRFDQWMAKRKPLRDAE